MTTIHGHADDGFGAVADAFRENFDDRNELGAAFSLYLDGVRRVDLWGGIADNRAGEAWTDETLALVFSTTKGATAICVAKLVEEGRLTYDDPVSDHWPEFGTAGKSDITVAQLMSHQAGLIGVEAPITFAEIMTVAPVVESLQGQTPEWPPGTAHGYHALTYGWLAGDSSDGSTGGRSDDSSPTRSPDRSVSSSGSASPRPRSTGSRASATPPCRPTRSSWRP